MLQMKVAAGLAAVLVVAVSRTDLIAVLHMKVAAGLAPVLVVAVSAGSCAGGSCL